MITTAELFKKYGTPNESGSPYLTKIVLPYPMILSWDKAVKVNSIRCHKMISNNLLTVFNEILQAYGLQSIQQLGIDLYGGCFNYRQMRGGNDWSRHSWGIAIDLDPARNLLHETRATARFARPEYQKMIDIFYRNGFLSLGVEKDYDWMHFEIKD
jgi:hypothetical protein